MQIHGSAHAHGPQGINGPHQRAASPAAETRGTGGVSDQLDISAAAQAVIDGSSSSVSRADRVAQIRQSISDGSYESTGKLASAVERLLDEIG